MSCYIPKKEAQRVTVAAAMAMAAAFGAPEMFRSLIAGDDLAFDSDAGPARMRLNSDDSAVPRKHLPPWVYIQFADPGRASEALYGAGSTRRTGDRLNHRSGKWNWMSLDDQSLTMLSTTLMMINARNLRREGR